MGPLTGDLHCHSRYSDGSATVESIVAYARRRGINCLALTDHDTMAGTDEFCACAKEAGITPIPGVECSAWDGERERPVHMLCYLPSDREALQSRLRETLDSRAKTKWMMVEKIMERFPIRREDVLRYSAGSASVYESHIMQALADQGYTNVVIGPLMDELIGRGGSCYVPNRYPEVRELTEFLRKTGGIPVLAHPGQFDSLALAEELAQKRMIAGIECRHPRNSPETTKAALLLAEKYDLIVTGGSDFHGQFAKRPHPIGACTTDDKQIRRLLNMR